MTARVVCIMGSGETSPTMVKVHRELVDRSAPSPSAVVLDTPFGFQENAGELTDKAVGYFRESVGRDLGVASLRDASAATALELETMLARLQDASYVFAGPGSPSYALRQWSGTAVPDVLRDKLRDGGVVTFASAAALTLGRCTIPVYEIYKVGGEVEWLDGLDLLSAAGLDVAVLPHWNNAEGGTHDTRYCYMGERRLRILEAQLPASTSVLGVDEHTACVIDLDAGTATVTGIGAVHVRRDGRVRSHPASTTVAIAALAEAGGAVTAAAPPTPAATATTSTSPLVDEVTRLRAAFDESVAAADGPAAAGAALELDAVLVEWASETFSGDEMAAARRALRSMVVRLGEGVADRRAAVAPFVDAVLSARDRLRAARDFAGADELRDALVASGVEVQDSPAGTTWDLR